MVSLRAAPGVLGLPLELSAGSFRADEVAAVRVTVPYRGHHRERGDVPLGARSRGRRRALGQGVRGRPASAHCRGEPMPRSSTDLDSRGFAILDRLRARLPRIRSSMMERQTPVAHRDRWAPDPTPTSARLARLGAAEAALYDDLVTDRFGDAVRLEQERIDWTWATAHLPS